LVWPVYINSLQSSRNPGRLDNRCVYLAVHGKRFKILRCIGSSSMRSDRFALPPDAPQKKQAGRASRPSQQHMSNAYAPEMRVAAELDELRLKL
jgi:hypothetical protein